MRPAPRRFRIIHLASVSASFLSAVTPVHGIVDQSIRHRE
jgi:hypothetical protein